MASSGASSVVRRPAIGGVVGLKTSLRGRDLSGLGEGLEAVEDVVRDVAELAAQKDCVHRGVGGVAGRVVRFDGDSGPL